VDLNHRPRHYEELPGILNWAILGCLKWQESGLNPPSKILNTIKEYKTEVDTIQNWMDDCWKPDPNPRADIKATALYQSYKNWTEKNGEYYKMTQRILGQKLKERGVEKTRKSGGIYCSSIEVSNIASYR